MKARRFARRLCRTSFAIVAIALCCAACTMQLAPSYSASLANGIHDVNADIMSLYSTMGMGTTAGSFASRADRYDEIIGKLDALTLQSQSRPIPNDDVTQKIEAYLKAHNAMPTKLTQEQEQLQQSIQARMAQRCALKLKLDATDPQSFPTIAGNGDDAIPSAMALRLSSRTLTLLRNKDCAEGLHANDVQVNKGQVEHFMYEAMTYEDMLNRQ
ncbi:hypothetical protein [Paraburkholderia acidiphila]|uniref:Lipoprotein n=1 Tax=Paraburkholderia acidiphila TaxID=2571747 RepID=A0A7Z2JDE4_9BURK|nr:hypothetical protein [Paraburkholderia acidiphila]QGZ59364.1 hypothetical protein FAZ97_30650 [Paraburkholderia acidiphila]